MRKRIKALFKILQDADEAVAFTTYKTTITYEDDDQPTPIAAKEVIKDPKSIPESITAMGNYFFELVQTQKVDRYGHRFAYFTTKR